MKIDVLGTKYTVLERTKQQDEYLKSCDGYCDKTSKKIVIVKESAESELECWEAYSKKILRHEIIHAFMFESGLHENWQHQKEWGHDETTVDWFAVLFSKLLAAYKAAGCI